MSSSNPCVRLAEAGVAVWLDSLSREIVQSGRLKQLIDTVALSGVTSNPAIFHQAMTKGSAYDTQLAELSTRNLSDEQIYEELAVTDIRMACDVLRPVHDRTGGQDGYVSLEVSPHLARDTAGTLTAARRLHAWVDRPNLLIKIPGTPEGVPAIEACLAEGIPINITLLFSIEAYESVAEAYLRALTRRAKEGKPLQVASVASFFISRIDTLTDAKLDERAKASSTESAEILAMRGQAAILNARLAYQSFLRIFGRDEFRRLQENGAWAQRPLWASTSTKNPAYRDVMYVETLIGPSTVNTMPMETIEGFTDHGVVAPNTVEHDPEGARRYFERLESVGVSFRAVTDQLLVEAIEKFNDPYDKLLASLGQKRAALGAA